MRVLLFLLFGCSIVAQAQLLSTKNKKAIALYTEADNYRVRGQYDQAIRLLQQAIDKDSKFEEAYFRLGDTYRNSGNRKAAVDSYEKAVVLSPYPIKQKQYLYPLSESYLRLGNYAAAKTSIEKFLAIEKTDKPKIEQATQWKTQAEYGLAHANEDEGYRVTKLPDTVNAHPMQYFPTLTADGKELIFTVRYGRMHDDNEDIFVSRKAKGRWQAPEPLSDAINSDYREGACSISADGRHLVFTICGPRGCDLFESRKTGDNWSKPVNLGPNINTNGWEAQPSLSADGNELYFVSERKGGFGGYDIWYSKKDSLGRWTRATNAGPSINTKFDEIAPYIHVNNQNLYFASNGLPGFGGFDIYTAERKRGQWQTPVNLGAPLNDFEDQYSFAVTSDGSTAYYSREEGRNSSKIYQAFIPEAKRVRSRGNIVEGIVRDAKTHKPLSAAIELVDIATQQHVAVFRSDSLTGEYLSVVPGRASYALHVARPGYLFASVHFNYEDHDLAAPYQLDVELQPIAKNATTVLNNIFFEYNKFEINEKSFSELDDVVQFLRDNPTVTVEISGHTDNVGNESYNEQLSQKRAQSVVNYISSKGIAERRLTRVGYGSKKPLRENDTEENRQVNRRIEFRILN